MQRHLDSIHDATLAAAWGHPDSDIIRNAAHVFDLLSDAGLDLDDMGIDAAGNLCDADTLIADTAAFCCLFDPEECSWDEVDYAVYEGARQGLMAWAWGVLSSGSEMREAA